MNKKRTLIVSLIVIAVIVIGVGAAYAQGRNGYGAGRGANGSNVPTCDTPGSCDPLGNQVMARSGNQSGLGLNLPPAVEGELPADVIEAMTAGITDEYHAYAVYQSVIDQFGAVAPFVNIQSAEAQHIAAWETIFARYNVAVPPVPTFDIPQFDSLTEACQAAADAEVANFSLYDQWLDTVQDYPDITQVVTSLRNVSEFNHLPAFEKCS